jgi:hypothetical protein
MPDPLPPRQYVVRSPSGDPAAARRLAAAYDGLADAVVTTTRLAATALHHLAFDWQGAGARAAHAPEEVLTADAARVARALRRSADDLRLYAHRLQRAHEHHGWSIGRLVTLGAMVSVGAAAVVVTVGAAAAAEAAAAAAAVEAAEAASASAAAAGESAALGLSSWHGLLAAVRPLAPFVAPHLVSAGASAALDAISQLAAGEPPDVHSVEVSAAVGFAGSSVGGAVEGRLAATPALARRAAEAGVWAVNGTAGGYADNGDVDAADTMGFALTGLVARDVRRAVDALPRAVRRRAR